LWRYGFALAHPQRRDDCGCRNKPDDEEGIMVAVQRCFKRYQTIEQRYGLATRYLAKIPQRLESRREIL
jgi:hypothetical protein